MTLKTVPYVITIICIIIICIVSYCYHQYILCINLTIIYDTKQSEQYIYRKKCIAINKIIYRGYAVAIFSNNIV